MHSLAFNQLIAAILSMRVNVHTAKCSTKFLSAGPRKKHVYIYRTRRNFRGGLIFVLFAGEVDARKLMRKKIKNYGPSP